MSRHTPTRRTILKAGGLLAVGGIAMAGHGFAQSDDEDEPAEGDSNETDPGDGDENETEPEPGTENETDLDETDGANVDDPEDGEESEAGTETEDKDC